MGHEVGHNPGESTEGGESDRGVLIELPIGDNVPETTLGTDGLRFSVSPAARSSKFVVPRVLLIPDRAEQTIATRCWSRCILFENFQLDGRWQVGYTYGMISSHILEANLPTLVPPYFWTSQGVDGSTGFWWRIRCIPDGGVIGGEKELESDILSSLWRLITAEIASKWANEESADLKICS